MIKSRCDRVGGSLATALFALATAASAQEPCPVATAAERAVRGFVLEIQASLPIDGALIEARWNGGESEATSGAGGTFELCGVPSDVPVVLQATVAPYQGSGVHLDAGTDAAGVMLAIDFELDEILNYSGRVMGRLVDRETQQPIANALVGSTARGFTVISDNDGRFLVPDLSPGEHTIKVRHLAYGERDNTIIVPYGTLEVEIRLTPTVIALEPLDVQIVRVRSVKLDRSGFYDRQDWGERLGHGHFVTRADIEGRAPGRMSHLLTELPRVGVLRQCSGPQCSVPFIRGTSRRCRELKDRGGELLIGASLYVDGHRTRMAVGRLDSFSLWGVDELMMPGDVAGIEIYSGYGDLPGEFADENATQCGAIVIWTGR